MEAPAATLTSTLTVADSSLPTVMTLMENLMEVALSLSQDQHKGPRFPAASLERLPSSLMRIKSVCLGIMRQRKVGDKRLQHWLKEVKYVVYDGNDLLDELYMALASQTESKVSRHISCSVKKLLGKYEPVNKLKDLLKRIDEIEKASETIVGLVYPIEAVEPVSFGLDTSFVPTRFDMIGREVECERLVSMLIDPMGASSGDQTLDYSAVGNIGMTKTLDGNGKKIGDQVSVIAIVGMCGIGKTMLAQCVFDDPRIKDHFETRIWALCPERFDEENLTRVVMDSAGLANTNHHNTLDVITKHFTKFLLVLDDLWIEENGISNLNESLDGWFQRWIVELHKKNRDSRILVTTRHAAIAKILNTKVLVLDRLKDEDEWLLFKKYALLRDVRSKDYPHLEKIGLEIVRKLQGVPFGAKIAGHMLMGKSTPEIWEEIVRKDIYTSMSTIIKFVLENLPIFLKPLLYFSCLFPKRYRIDRDNMVNLWIANDFIRSQEGHDKTLEDLGSEHFNELVNYHVFQPVKQGEVRKYYLHDLIHDLAKSICTEESITNCDCCGTIQPMARHLFLTKDHWGLTMVEQGQASPSLQYLYLSGCRLTDPWIQTTVEQTQVLRLRILDLSGCGITHASEALGNLIHLRYLSVSEDIRILPRSIISLLHLQTLRIPEKARLSKLPESMNKLINMRHLDISTTYIAGISGIGRMVHLCCSVEFHVKKLKGFNLCELKNLEFIGPELCIRNLENVTYSEALKVKLKCKKRLKKLSLVWSCEIRMISDHEKGVLDFLEPPVDLCKLSIVRYSGNFSPIWLEEKLLCNLKEVFLINCNGWKDLPPLGQLPCLEVLHIKEMHAVKVVGPNFYGRDEDAFPKLKELELNVMPQWSEWIARDNGHAFCSLEKLIVIDCPKLSFMPMIPITVKKMELRRTLLIHRLLLGPSGLARSRKISLETSSLTISKLFLQEEHMKAVMELILWQCENIPEESEFYKLFTNLKQLCIHQSEIKDSVIAVLLHELKTLSSLEIISCPNIESVPIVKREIQLEVLHIRDCQLLSSLAVLNSSQSLKTLVVERCPMFSQQSLPSNMHTLNSLKHFGVSHCPKFMSLPPHGFPTSLLSLSLVGCEQNLMKGLIDGTHAEYHKIKHIPKVVIH